jgi:uncharacterized protein (TIGR02145 family)
MLLNTCKKNIVTISTAALFFTACGDDKSSSSSDAIPNYKSESSLPNTCQMEIAQVQNTYYACLKDEWVIVMDSAIVKQITEGVNVEDLDFANIVAITSSNSVAGDGKQSIPSSESNSAGTSSSENSTSSSIEGDNDGDGSSSSSEEGNDGDGSSSSSEEGNDGDGSSSSSEEGNDGDGSSSSSEESSSSESVPDGYMKDSRDGTLYKTVVIGSQTWMAQNLSYEYKINGRAYGTHCRDNNCTKYGRYYTWGAAMDSAKTKCGYKKDCSVNYPVKGICDDGWHLPSKADWEKLFKSVGGAEVAGTKLRSKDGWINSIIHGTDPYKFTALPAGKYENGSFNENGYGAFFWTSTKADKENAYLMNIDIDYNTAYLKYSTKNLALSVRCVKN